MTLSQKLREHINSKDIYRVSTLARLAEIDRLHLHLFLRSGKDLKDEEVERLFKVIKFNKI